MTASHEIDLKPILQFLSELQKNNNKAWFEQNRPSYEGAKTLFEGFVDQLIGEYGAVEDLGRVTAKDCVMRIYRDIRFSKDKSPYKTNMGASIGPGGKKSTRLSYYLHIEPHDLSIIAGGLHSPDSAQLSKFREAIDRDPRAFKSVVGAKGFRQLFGSVEGDRLKTVPKGYERGHPELGLLQLKEVVAVHHLTDAVVTSPKFDSHVIATFKAMKPFLDYLNSVAL